MASKLRGFEALLSLAVDGDCSDQTSAVSQRVRGYVDIAGLSRIGVNHRERLIFYYLPSQGAVKRILVGPQHSSACVPNFDNLGPLFACGTTSRLTINRPGSIVCRNDIALQITTG